MVRAWHCLPLLSIASIVFQGKALSAVIELLIVEVPLDFPKSTFLETVEPSFRQPKQCATPPVESWYC